MTMAWNVVGKNKHSQKGWDLEMGEISTGRVSNEGLYK